MSIRDYFYNRKLDKMERMMRAVQNRIQFNPDKAGLNLYEYLNEDEFSRRIREYQVWSTGNSNIIRQYYLSSSSEDDMLYFWKKAKTNQVKRHAGIPKAISTKMGTLIFGSDFKINVVVYKTKEDGSISSDIDEEQTKKANETINALIDKMGLINKWREQATTESWCGHTFGKLNYDVELSDFPIYETFDLTKAESVVNRGIVVGYKFKSRYEKRVGNTTVCYEFQEYYTTNEQGYAKIENHLYKFGGHGLEEVSLTEIEETSGLEPEYIFEDIKGLLAFGKPNKLPNCEFPHSNYGASDYEGSLDSFDSMDEAYSELYSEVRNNKTIRYVPNTMIKDGKVDPFITNYQLVEGTLDQNAKNEIQIQPIQDKTESILAKYRNALTTAINNAGLSPLALGITGLESISASDQSQKERNKVSIETRKDKINSYWIPYLKNFITQLLAFNNWLVKNKAVDQEGIDTQEISFANCDIQFDFGEYVVEDESNVINRLVAAKSGGIASVEECVRQLHPEWNETQITQEVTRIKFESNMGVDDPTLLQMTYEDTE